MTEKVFNSGSYEEALNIIGEYVNITQRLEKIIDSFKESLSEISVVNYSAV